MRAPDRQGGVAKAWRMSLEAKEAHGTVDHWLVEGPFHAFWDRWVMTVVHLRSEPGLSEPTKQFPEATHEFLVFALNPEKSKDFDPDKPIIPIPFLTPIDQCVQFQVGSDAQAREVLELAVRACCDGIASPDQDFRGWWAKTIPSTAEHVRTGHHLPQDKGMH